MIVEEKNLNGGTQVLHRFDNGYGASVIQGPYSYGGPEGKYEIGVIKWGGGAYALTYDTPITDDVLGYVEPGAVQGYLDRIEALTEEKVEIHSVAVELRNLLDVVGNALERLEKKVRE